MLAMMDLEALQDVSAGAKQGTTPLGEEHTESADFTLSKEWEEENIIGNKEHRADGEDTDGTNSKRPKVPPTKQESKELSPYLPLKHPRQKRKRIPKGRQPSQGSPNHTYNPHQHYMHLPSYSDTLRTPKLVIQVGK
jgi:hypothetical protein